MINREIFNTKIVFHDKEFYMLMNNCNDYMILVAWINHKCEVGFLTFSSRVPQHGVSHHYYRPAEHMGQNEHVKLL